MPEDLLQFKWDNSYATLSTGFYQSAEPLVAPHPQLILFNDELAKHLGLLANNPTPSDEKELAETLSGNRLPMGSASMAQAYAGHQFGGFTMLGDGRALLLGEHLTPQGERFDIQLKGSGPTAYSRRGDGKATLKAMLREYIMSEALFHLGIPTTRSLAVVLTGEPVYRNPIQPGAVLTRVAKSHIRVGNFEYVRQFLPAAEAPVYLDYVLDRHYPEIIKNAQESGWSTAEKTAAFLSAVMEKQISLVLHWMRVGFVHGVMNTDNMSIPGETIDYGPCAFMNAYSPATVFSSIDTQGRYAFGNQAPIAQWNLACLANALLPLLAEDTTAAVATAQSILNQFPALYQAGFDQMMAQKLGFEKATADTIALSAALLEEMEKEQADYTQCFWHLTQFGQPLSGDKPYPQWFLLWQALLASSNTAWPKAQARMQKMNPAFIPRNHRVEAVLDAAELGHFQPLQELLVVLSKPYEYQAQFAAYQSVPADGDKGYQTFCGT
jgi:serine/tyrosine/threonine adenylyltransferase